MPSKRTKRGVARTPIDGDYDVIVCGASFAGLATARELAGMRRSDGDSARVLILDRYEIGERQTSACATPEPWLDALGLRQSMLQSFDELVLHTYGKAIRLELPWSFATFDYRLLCSLLAEQCDAEFETATVTGTQAPGRDGLVTIETDRGDLRAPLLVDALGWRRVLGPKGYQPPEAPLSRGLEVHPHGSGDALEVWVDRSLIPAGYGWSFPAKEEVRVGVGSFDPRTHVRRPTVALAETANRPADGYQGNWIPHQLRNATEGEIFFAGDSAGHCLPLTAEGIRTAFYFGIAAGREIRRVVEGRATRATSLRRYAAFSAAHDRQFRMLLDLQRLVPHLPPWLMATAARAAGGRKFTQWSFNRYLNAAHPSFASPAPRKQRAHPLHRAAGLAKA